MFYVFFFIPMIKLHLKGNQSSTDTVAEVIRNRKQIKYPMSHTTTIPEPTPQTSSATMKESTITTQIISKICRLWTVDNPVKRV